MPLYPFECEDCQQTFEQLVSGSSPRATPTCPECSSEKVRRLFGQPARPIAMMSPSGGGCASDGPSCGAPWCRKPKS